MPKKKREIFKYRILSHRDGGFDYKIVTTDGNEVINGWAAGTRAQVERKLKKDVKNMNDRMIGEIRLILLFRQKLLV